MLTKEIIANIRAFMERGSLSGREVPAYNEIMTALAQEEARLLSPPSPAVTPAAPPE